MSARNKQTIENVNAAFARNDVQGFLDHCVDDVVWSIVGDTTVRGKQAIADWMKSMGGDSSAFTVEALAADGDFVMACGDMTMNDKDGVQGRYSYCDVYRFAAERIAELKSFVIKADK